ncbi:hypothetical protein EDM54_23845 [Brevibacillus borstelensis]|uniref:hypothetical protein n=1 Tax=Brevibacillus borstelensis TaxID=45462 RepID=UPI000F089114|nr:hypothetical protein [Brevibacillus borstelensis]MED1882374.1 hypothetical protein [Brevibacillus borstelensis]RNB56654.1 hypothetical protein EDM54_23845 [Brevibacillus borstelensis]GED55462.1 hypothetical protein BBO01nite_47030 [Brevibacillus borstelensis]
MRQLVDPDTGEVFYEEQILRRPDEIVKVFRPVGRSSKFVKIKASQKAKRRLRKLSLAEAGFLLKISLYASEGTNLLEGDNERGQKGTPLTVKDLARIANCSYPTARKIVKILIELQVLRRTHLEGRSVLAINPLYSLNGKTAEAWLLQLFKQEITEAGEDPNSE